MAIVDVCMDLSSVEPVMAFIARVCRAEAWLQRLTTEQAAALPDEAVAGFLLIQHAVRDLSGGLPSMASVLAEARAEVKAAAGEPR
jgi:hypothetical protein